MRSDRTTPEIPMKPNVTRIPLVTALVVCCTGWLVLSPGCGRQPQVASGNRELVVSLATAISTRNHQWLEENARLVEARRSEGQVSDQEYQALSAILASARAGKWKAAEDAVYALRDAQVPTAEDLNRLSTRKLAPDHQASKTSKKPPRPGN